VWAARRDSQGSAAARISQVREASVSGQVAARDPVVEVMAAVVRLTIRTCQVAADSHSRKRRSHRLSALQGIRTAESLSRLD